MNKKKCFEGGKEVPEDLKECSTFGYPFDKDFAEFKLKERKAIKWLRYGICGSILIVILVLVVIHILGNRNKDYRSEEIIKYLQENEVSFSKEETTNTSKHEGYIKFEDDGDCTVNLHYNYWNGDYANLAGDAEYSVVYDFWGKEYLKLNIKWYKDTSVWEMLVGIDEKGNIIALKNKNENAYIDTEIENKNIPIIYRNSQDIIYFIVVLVIAIVVCGMLIINVFTIQKSYKIRTKEKKLKLQQDKINTEKEKLAAEWDEKTKLLGYTGCVLADTLISPKGYRILFKIPRIPTNVIENLIKHFGQLKNVLEASSEDLDQVEGIGEARAAAIKNGLKRIKEQVNLKKEL